MRSTIDDICEQLVEIYDQFEENDQIVDAMSSSENAEGLFIAIGMAVAYSNGAITLNKTGENHLRSALEQINEITEEFEEDDE